MPFFWAGKVGSVVQQQFDCGDVAIFGGAHERSGAFAQRRLARGVGALQRWGFELRVRVGAMRQQDFHQTDGIQFIVGSSGRPPEYFTERVLIGQPRTKRPSRRYR